MNRTLTIAWVVLVMIGCGGDPAGPDASGVDAQGHIDSGPVETPCARIEDCDDGRYCNGMERCVDAVCVAGDPPCAAGDTCDEAAGACVSEACTGGPDMDGDLDGDGHKPSACGGEDCDDTDSDRFPGNPEVCDLSAPDHDEDCNPMTYGFLDIDVDGAADARCFNIREMDGMRFGGTDCNDNNASIHPLATERCDGTIDEDCDGMVDEGCPCTPEGSVRACGSQVGECAGATEACTALGWSACGPAPATEICDGSRDEDCDGAVDEGCTCVSGTTRPCGLGACAVAQQSCVAGVWDATSCPSGSAETCNGIDDNCDGTIDNVPGLGDACGSSVGRCHPGVMGCVAGSATLVCGGPGHVVPSAEVCDGSEDEDCDGTVDEGCACVSGTTQPCGVGACAVALQTCVAGTWNTASCPSPSTETCNGIDDNCDGTIDNVAGLGTTCGSSVGLCRPGVRSCVTGSSALVCAGPGYVAPVAEVCDHQDNDCDASIDDGVSIAAECTRSFAAFDCSGSSTCVQLSSRTNGNQSPRAAFGQGWSGDFGRANLFRGNFRLSDTLATDEFLPEGIVALVISPNSAVGPESGSCGGLCLSDGLPLLSAGQEGMAVMLVHGRLLYLMRGTSAGWTAVGDSAPLPVACFAIPGAGAAYRLELSNVAGSFTATAVREGCGSATVTWSSTATWTALYGAGPTYPRYRIGLVGDADFQMFIERTGLLVNRRVRSGDRNNCIGC